MSERNCAALQRRPATGRGGGRRSTSSAHLALAIHLQPLRSLQLREVSAACDGVLIAQADNVELVALRSTLALARTRRRVALRGMNLATGDDHVTMEM